MCSRLAAGVAAFVGAAFAASADGPPPIDGLLRDVLKLERSDLDHARRGHPVTTALVGAMDREIVVAGTVRVSASASRVVDLFRDIETLEQGKGFTQTVQLSEPPRLEDFAGLRWPAEDLRELRRCRAGACKVHLTQRGFDLLARMNWSAADVAAEADNFGRQMALDIFSAYRTGGAAAVGPCLEDRPARDTAGEFAQMLSGKPFLDTATPGLAPLLTNYPRGPRPTGLEEIFYWSLIEFGLKKTIRLNHIVLYPLPGSNEARWVIANRLIWASHYFQNAVEVRLLVEDPAAVSAAHDLVVLNLARPDGLTGVFGPVVRYKVRSGSRDALRKTLAITKSRAEGPPPATR